MANRSTCADIYQEAKVDGLNMYELRSKRVMLKYKHDRAVIERKLARIKVMLALTGLVDVFFIKCVLKRIRLAKQLFVLELEHSQEVYIPDELSCDRCPSSFHYYDPIIQITNQLFSVKQKLYHCLKTEFYLKKLKGNDFKRDFLERAGCLATQGTWKQTFKHGLIVEKDKNEVKVQQSKHTMSLQKSRYLMVESTEAGLKLLADLQTYVIEQKWTRGPRDANRSLEDLPLELRYCRGAEVNDKRQRFLVFKQNQYMRHEHLKNQGQKLHTVQLMQAFIEKELDELYKNRPRDLDYNPGRLAQDKDLDLRPYHTLSGRQRCSLDKDRRKYADYLLTYAEDKVLARRTHMRTKCLAECYQDCGPGVAFQQKNRYIEARLEQRLKYFDHMHDLKHPGVETEQLRKELFKLARTVKTKKAQRADPYAVLSALSANEKTFMEDEYADS